MLRLCKLLTFVKILLCSTREFLCHVQSTETYASVNSSGAQSPPPLGLLRSICPPFCPGSGAFANFALPGGRAFANPGVIPELLTRTQFAIRI